MSAKISSVNLVFEYYPNAARCCFPFLQARELGIAASVSKKFLEYTNDERVWKVVKPHLERLNANFWKFNEISVRDEIVYLFVQNPSLDWKVLPPHQQFKKIALAVSRAISNEDLHKKLEKGMNSQRIELFLACGVKRNEKTFAAALKGMKERCSFDEERELDDSEFCFEIYMTLLNNGVKPQSLDPILWRFVSNLSSEKAIMLFEKLLASPDLKVYPEALHDAVTKPRGAYHITTSVPVKCLALLHEKTGVKPMDARIDSSTFIAGLWPYRGDNAPDFIQLMLRAGAVPSANILRTFLYWNDPTQEHMRDEDYHPISIEKANECVDLLLSKMTPDEISKLTPSHACGYGREMVLKLHKAGAPLRGYPDPMTCALVNHPFIEAASALMECGATPTKKALEMIEERLRDKPEKLQEFRELFSTYLE